MQVTEIILYVVLFIILVLGSIVLGKLYTSNNSKNLAEKESFAVGGGRPKKLKKRKKYTGGAAAVKTVDVDGAATKIAAAAPEYLKAGHQQTGQELSNYVTALKAFNDAWIPLDNVGINAYDTQINTDVGAILASIDKLGALNQQKVITEQNSTDYTADVDAIKNVGALIKTKTDLISAHIVLLISDSTAAPANPPNPNTVDAIKAVKDIVAAETARLQPAKVTENDVLARCNRAGQAAAELIAAGALLVSKVEATLGGASDDQMRYISSFIDDADAVLTPDIIKATYQIAPMKKELYNRNLLGDPTKQASLYDPNKDNFKHSAEVIKSVRDFIEQYFAIRGEIVKAYTAKDITFAVADASLNDITVSVELLLKTYYQFDDVQKLPRLVTFLAGADKNGVKEITVFNEARTTDIDALSAKIKQFNTLFKQIPAFAGKNITAAQFDGAIDALKANSVTPWYPLVDGAQPKYFKIISPNRLRTDKANALIGKLITSANNFAGKAGSPPFDTNNVRASIQASLVAYQALKTDATLANNLTNVTADRMDSYVTVLMYIDYVGRFLDYLLSLYVDADAHQAAGVQQIDVIIQKLFRQTNLKSGDTDGQNSFQRELFGRDKDGNLKAPNPPGLEYNPDLDYKKLIKFVNDMVRGTPAEKSFAFKLYNIAYSFRLILPPSLEALPLVIDPSDLTLTTSRVPVNSATSIKKLDAIMAAITKAYAVWRYGIAAVECGERTNDKLLTQTDLLLTDPANGNGLLDNYNKFKQALANGSLGNKDSFTASKDALFESFKQFRWKLMSKRNFTSDEDGPDTDAEKQIYSNMKLAATGGKIPYNPYYDKLQQYLTVADGSTDVTTLIKAFTAVAEPYNGILDDGKAFDYPFTNDPVTNKSQRAGALTVTWPDDKSATFRRIYELLVYNGSKVDTDMITVDRPPSLMALFIKTLNSPELNIPKQIGAQLNIQATSFGPGAIGSTQPPVEPPPATVEAPQFKTYKVAPTDSVSFTSLSEGSILTAGDLKQTTGNVVVVADSVDDLNLKIQRIMVTPKNIGEKSGGRNLYGLVIDINGETAPLFKSVAIELGMKPPADIERLIGDKRKGGRGWLYDIKQYPNGEFYLSVITYIKPVEYQV